jgi:hypothetical protein
MGQEVPNTLALVVVHMLVQAGLDIPVQEDLTTQVLVAVCTLGLVARRMMAPAVVLTLALEDRVMPAPVVRVMPVPAVAHIRVQAVAVVARGYVSSSLYKKPFIA